MKTILPVSMLALAVQATAGPMPGPVLWEVATVGCTIMLFGSK